MQVRAFYEEHYSSNQMRLAVYGAAPAGALEAAVRAKFAGVPNRGIERPTFAEDIVTPDQTCRLMKVRAPVGSS